MRISSVRNKQEHFHNFLFYTIIILSIFSISNAQTVDPLSFFPSAVGNVWEYSGGEFEWRGEIYKDSVDNEGLRYIFYKYDDSYSIKPAYKIDSLNSIVYEVPYNPNNPHWLYYKLDADIGDHWIVYIYPENDTLNAYLLAKVTAVYQGYFYNRFTTFKDITYYNLQPDSVITEQSWPDWTITLAAGIGEILQIDEDGTPQVVFSGCIINGDTVGTITSIQDIAINPDNFNLFQNYPNPFNPSTTLRYAVKEEGLVKLIVYSPLGEEVKTLVNEYQKTGTYEVKFTAGDLPSGIYFYKLTSGKSTDTKKLILLK